MILGTFISQILGMHIAENPIRIGLSQNLFKNIGQGGALRTFGGMGVVDGTV